MALDTPPVGLTLSLAAQLTLHPAAVPGGAALIVSLLLLLFFAAVRHYSDPCDRHPLATCVTVLSLTATLLVVLMVPLDVYAVSTGELDLGAVRMRLDALERLRLHVLLEACVQRGAHVELELVEGVCAAGAREQGRGA